MKPQQKKLCELMLEFHALCEKQNAAYYLVGPQLLHAAQDGELHGYEMDVAMFYKDWKKIRRQVTPDGDREIESILDHGNLPGCYFRYVDKNSLLLDMGRYGMLAKPGIGINIHIIRAPRKKSQLLTYLEQGMEEGAKGDAHSFAGILVRVLRKCCRDRFDRKMMQLLFEVRAQNGDVDTELKLPGQPPRAFVPGFWGNRTAVTLADMTLYAAEDYKIHLINRYGKNWARAKTDVAEESYRCVFSPSLPYAQYMEQVEKEGLITRRFIKRFQHYVKKYGFFEEKKDMELLGWEKSLFFSGERFRLWKKYMPLKERILTLYEAGLLDEVELLLTDYLTVLNKYLRMNMVLCFDSDILDVVKKVYLAYGQKAIVRKIDNYVLQEDLLPIKATWRTEAEE